MRCWRGTPCRPERHARWRPSSPPACLRSGCSNACRIAAATRQRGYARQAGDCRRKEVATPGPLPGRTCSRMSQPGAEACRKAPERGRQAAQGCHHRDRTQAYHYRKCDPENRRDMAISDQPINTISSVLNLTLATCSRGYHRVHRARAVHG